VVAPAVATPALMAVVVAGTAMMAAVMAPASPARELAGGSLFVSPTKRVTQGP
jgi:hypothetical protein